MPIYEYQCKKCEEVFETLFTSTSDLSVSCSHCGSSDVQKLISAPGKSPVNIASQPAKQCQPRGGFS